MTAQSPGTRSGPSEAPHGLVSAPWRAGESSGTVNKLTGRVMRAPPPLIQRPSLISCPSRPSCLPTSRRWTAGKHGPSRLTRREAAGAVRDSQEKLGTAWGQAWSPGAEPAAGKSPPPPPGLPPPGHRPAETQPSQLQTCLKTPAPLLAHPSPSPHVPTTPVGLSECPSLHLTTINLVWSLSWSCLGWGLLCVQIHMDSSAHSIPRPLLRDCRRKGLFFGHTVELP